MLCAYYWQLSVYFHICANSFILVGLWIFVLVFFIQFGCNLFSFYSLLILLNIFSFSSRSCERIADFFVLVNENNTERNNTSFTQVWKLLLKTSTVWNLYYQTLHKQNALITILNYLHTMPSASAISYLHSMAVTLAFNKNIKTWPKSQLPVFQTIKVTGNLNVLQCRTSTFYSLKWIKQIYLLTN